jgi:tripartite-type tricarboxylate transporter receptor subunit TctC
MAPSGTPTVIVAKVSADISQALQAADMKARFEPQGMVLISSTPERFDTVIRTDTERYAKIIKPAS